MTQTLDVALAALALFFFGYFARRELAAKRRGREPSMAEAGNAAFALAGTFYFLGDALAAVAHFRVATRVGTLICIGVAAMQTYRAYRRLKTPASPNPTTGH